MISRTQQILTHRDPLAPAAEAYRVLRTNLQFSSPDTPIRSLVITSATPGEGKTTTIANLAVAIAQSGKKVLLVDGDMRKPTIHKVFGLSNANGLSNLIISGDSANGFIQSCWVNDLFILSSGPVPPNPAELLGSKRTIELFAEFEQKYDMVIVDSPPVGAGSVASILSTLTSATLLVVSYGQVAREQAKSAVDQLRNVKANIVGVVINRVNTKETGYYYYEYGS